MIYQCNVVVTVLIFLFSALSLFKYISVHYDSVFFWLTITCTSMDCIDTYFGGPVGHKDPVLYQLLREDFFVPPPPDPDTTGVNIYEPVWRKLIDWDKVQEKLKEMYEYQPPGVFVEIGASDGDFMSQTLYLEKNLSWSGLLLEPDPRAFTIMKQRKRNATIAPLCIHYDSPTGKKYWLRTIDDDLPTHFKQLLMARSKLVEETLEGDEERGTTVWVLCVPLSTILMAANMTKVDFLTIASGVDEDDVRIKDVIRNRNFDVKVLLIHYPTIRLFKDPYPRIPGYINDMGHSTLLVKLYIKSTYCKLVEYSICKYVNYFDTIKACNRLLCFGYLEVWTSGYQNKSQ